jgi:ATP-dependent Clp protease ATP-binding subunit ClpC
MTSNLGVKKMQEFGQGIGFTNANNVFINEELRKDTLKKELKKFFSPEFLNRIDDIVVFNSLNEEHVGKIVNIELQKLISRLNGMKYNITIDDSINKMICKVGFDEMYGARPIKRAIQDKIEDYISEEVLRGNIKENEKYLIKTDDGDTVITTKKRGK